MYTKQKLSDELQEIKTGVDSLIQLVSDFDQDELEEGLYRCFEPIFGKMSCLISSSEVVLSRMKDGLNVDALMIELEKECTKMFLYIG
jgi:hypothetical protein